MDTFSCQSKDIFLNIHSIISNSPKIESTECPLAVKWTNSFTITNIILFSSDCEKSTTTFNSIDSHKYSVEWHLTGIIENIAGFIPAKCNEKPTSGTGISIEYCYVWICLLPSKGPCVKSWNSWGSVPGRWWNLREVNPSRRPLGHCSLKGAVRPQSLNLCLLFMTCDVCTGTPYHWHLVPSPEAQTNWAFWFWMETSRTMS